MRKTGIEKAIQEIAEHPTILKVPTKGSPWSGRIGITADINRALEKIRSATASLNSGLVLLDAAQKRCKHVWVFVGQINAFHEHKWETVHRCAICILEQRKVGSPLCPTCIGDIKLVQATDEKAKARVKKMGYPPFSGTYKPYRCPQCKKLHILQTRGD